MNHRTPLYILCVLLLTAFFSCVGTAPTKEVRFIDSLNRRAYAYRYKNLDSSYLPAEQAYGQARLRRCMVLPKTSWNCSLPI